MNILLAAAECSPLAKVGGLADVVGALPSALMELKHDARVILPFYQSIKPDAVPSEPALWFNVEFGDKEHLVEVFETNLPYSEARVYLVSQPDFFSGSIYENKNGEPGGAAEIEKFLFFSAAVLEFLKKSSWQPQVVHVHDWHAAIIPLLIKKSYINMPTVLTIHNVAAQGLAAQASIAKLHPAIISEPEVGADLAHKSGVNILRQGILNASKITTVSPTYAQEILSSEYGAGLENDLRSRGVTGIINGIDELTWNESNDPLIAAHYDSFTLELKMQNKAVIQQFFGLDVDPEIPLVGVVSRLTPQKGLDLLQSMETDFINLPVQLAVLGVGDEKIESFFQNLAERFPKRFAIAREFSEIVAHQLYAGSDIFLMPSRFEPCGLGQMIAMHYGSLPLARRTGGLADTVAPLNEEMTNVEEATGFMIEVPEAQELITELARAASIFQNDAVTWRRLQQNAMVKNFSWKEPAKKYGEVYGAAVGNG